MRARVAALAVLLSLGTSCTETQTEALARGDVTTETGAPVEGAVIEATLFAECAATAPLGATSGTETDSTGSYETWVVSNEEQPQQVCVVVDAIPPTSSGLRAGTATGTVRTRQEHCGACDDVPIVTIDVVLLSE